MKSTGKSKAAAKPGKRPASAARRIKIAWAASAAQPVAIAPDPFSGTAANTLASKAVLLKFNPADFV